MDAYLLGGIGLVSEIALPELSRCSMGAAACPPQAHIRLGSVPASLPDGIEVDPECFVSPVEYLLRVPGVAAYRVSHGREIVIEPASDALPLDVRAYLLGAVFAVLCHQRGLLPLHASAVSCEGGVIAFLGHSEAGKSSIAANLALRGFPIMADDICLVDARREGPAMAIPVAPWIKLWRASLDHLGLSPDGLEPVFSEDDKYRFAVAPVAEPQPIRKLIFLDRLTGPTPGPAAITKLAPFRALPLLMNLTHQAYLLEASGKREENFLDCGRVASQAPAYRLSRPWGFAHMDSTIDSIESFLRQDRTISAAPSPV